MRCHQHLDSEAVAVCVSCGRAVCRECQKTTHDERTLCGLPQCNDYARRQAAVQFAVRQDCSNNASNLHLLAGTMKTLGVILIALCVAIFLWEFVVNLLFWRVFRDPVVNLVFIAIFAALASVVISASRKLRAIGQNFEDISREFG